MQREKQRKGEGVGEGKEEGEGGVEGEEEGGEKKEGEGEGEGVEGIGSYNCRMASWKSVKQTSWSETQAGDTAILR